MILEKAVQNVLKQTGKEIKNRAGYLVRSLHNAPKRATRQPPESQRVGANYEQATVPNKVYFPNPDGGEPIDSGMTVEEYLQSIKGGYRAKGSGSFMRRERNSNSYKRNNDKRRSIYHNAAGKREWAEPITYTGELTKKGTAKFSDAERRKLEKLRARERALILKQNAKSKKALQSIQKQIAEAEKKANYKRKLTPRQRAMAAQKATTLRAKYAAKEAELKKTKAAKVQEFRDKNRRYRIVAPKGHEMNPKPYTILRKKIDFNEVRTWSGAGGLQNYIAKHWNLDKVNNLQYNLSLQPIEEDNYLYRIEHGGSFETKPIVYGYLVNFHDSARLSHRRISFLPLLTKPKQVKVTARHWIQKKMDDVQKKFMEAPK